MEMATSSLRFQRYFINEYFLLFQVITNDTTVKDITGERLNALHVLEMSFKFLIDDVLHIMKSKGLCGLLYKYVIVVPTHFDQNMQDFIRKAAEKVL